MLQRDYIVRQIRAGVEAIVKALAGRKDDDPDLSCESIESMLGTVSDMDPEVLLSLSPESIGTILDLGGTMNDSVAEVVVHGMVLEADILEREKNDPSLAKLRLAQAKGIADTFKLDFNELSDVIDEQGVTRMESELLPEEY